MEKKRAPGYVEFRVNWKKVIGFLSLGAAVASVLGLVIADATARVSGPKVTPARIDLSEGDTLIECYREEISAQGFSGSYKANSADINAGKLDTDAECRRLFGGFRQAVEMGASWYVVAGDAGEEGETGEQVPLH